jgi:two-component system response regulator HydG
MFIQVKDRKDNILWVPKLLLPKLILAKEIKELRRSSGWVDIENDQRKSVATAYNGRERRITNIIHFDSDLLTVRNQLEKGYTLNMILGSSPKIEQIIFQINKVASTLLSVLVQGETGVGKGVLAAVIHELSERKDKPFIAIDCGAIPETLIESELFGHEKGSFTGAYQKKIGKFQMANGGTIFLDEFGNLPNSMQIKLLRCLEERVIYPVGSVKPIELDVRIIYATNANLLDEVKTSNFREDLYYRLNEFEIYIPPLRERPDDVFFLANKFLFMFNIEFNKNVLGFTKKAGDFFMEYSWPGNIREMKNVIKRAVLLADKVVDMEHLPDNLFTLKRKELIKSDKSIDSFLEEALIKGYSMDRAIQNIKEFAEKDLIGKALNMTNNKSMASKVLKIDYSTFYRKFKKYDLAFQPKYDNYVASN